MLRRVSCKRELREHRERRYRLRAKTSRFIPDADSDFARMAKVFSKHVAEQAARFPLSPRQVEMLTASVKAFRSALKTALWSDTRGPVATRLKNHAREQAEKVVRAVARILRGMEEGSLTSVDRLMLNLHERPGRLKRRACPNIAPVLKYVGSTSPPDSHCHGRYSGGRHRLEYGNDFDRASGAKPHGVARMELFVELVPVGDPVPTHPGQLSGGRLWYLRSFTNSRFEVDFPVLADGTPMLVVYWGRWADACGGVGPFSRTCVARVEGGSNMALPQGTRVQRVETKYVVVQARYALPEPLETNEELDAVRMLPAAQAQVM